jgi:GTP-binding protein Era
MAHKAGFVNIIGKPNVGKSTLMNSLVGEKLSIVTFKAQTTRHRIMGIVNGEDFQIVFSDTPGIIQPHYKLHHSMMKHVESAFQDADLLLYIQEANDRELSAELIEKMKGAGIPVIVILNKIDLSTQDILESRVMAWKEALPGADIIPISALLHVNIQSVLDKVLEKMPENPPFYDKDALTDKNMRFFVSEIIREKILLNYRKEVPYSAEVAVDQYKEEQDIIRISAMIYVARESQKAILLGHQGQAIKKVGVRARQDLEEWLGKKIYLELTVKVSKDWRDDDQQLQRFGYEL